VPVRLPFLVLVLLVCVSGLCAAPEGILHPGPGTTVDGTIAPEGMHVFGGQLLQTIPGRFSELLTRGSSLKLLGDTKLLFNDNSGELISGGVVLSTSSQFAVASGCASVTPLSTNARYMVQLQKSTIYVTAQQNSVAVKTRKTVHVDAGKTVAVYCASVAQSIVFLGRDLPAKVIMGSAAAATPIAALPASDSKSDMSPPSPSHR
jgi:hypothetical protein